MPCHSHNSFARPRIPLIRRVVPSGDPYRFTAREFDTKQSLLYNRTRYYDPAPGCWTSEDPVGFDASDEHLYRYPAPLAGPDDNPCQ
jgi:RHS repeat-associated protein